MKFIASLRLVALLTLAVGLLVPALALADSPQQASVTSISLSLNEFAISPASFTVTAGQAITINSTNTGKFPHNVAFQLGSVNTTIYPKNLTAGQSAIATFTFPTAGTWRMYCPVDGHADRGMVGTVTVLAANSPALPQTGGGGLALFELGVAACAVVLLVGLGVVGGRRIAKGRG